MTDQKDESQVDGSLVTLTDGDKEPQPEVTLPEAIQPGAEEPSEVVPSPEEPSRVSKTYSEEEVRKREAEITSKLQAEGAQYRQYAEQLALRQQMAEAQAQEQKLVAKDAQDVEQGIITQEDADQKQTARTEIAQLQALRQQHRGQAEADARVIVINQLVSQLQEQYGVKLNIGDFLGDANIRHPADVAQKALVLINAGLKAQLRAATVRTQVYDKGPGAGGTRNVGADRIIRAYGEGDSGVSRQDYEKAMKQKGLS